VPCGLQPNTRTGSPISDFSGTPLTQAYSTFTRKQKASGKLRHLPFSQRCSWAKFPRPVNGSGMEDQQELSTPKGRWVSRGIRH
jgi:hypothetical protein